MPVFIGTEKQNLGTLLISEFYLKLQLSQLILVVACGDLIGLCTLQSQVIQLHVRLYFVSFLIG